MRASRFSARASSARTLSSSGWRLGGLRVRRPARPGARRPLALPRRARPRAPRAPSGSARARSRLAGCFLRAPRAAARGRPRASTASRPAQPARAPSATSSSFSVGHLRLELVEPDVLHLQLGSRFRRASGRLPRLGERRTKLGALGPQALELGLQARIGPRTPSARASASSDSRAAILVGARRLPQALELGVQSRVRLRSTARASPRARPRARQSWS